MLAVPVGDEIDMAGLVGHGHVAELRVVDIVALSFTGCMNPNQIVDGLAELRGKLQPGVRLWAGGSAPVLHRRPVDGVEPFSTLTDVSAALRRTRQPA